MASYNFFGEEKWLGPSKTYVHPPQYNSHKNQEEQIARLTKLDRMSAEEKAAESNRFWVANDSAQSPPETVAIVLGLSLSWLQNKRINGGGIPFFKLDGRKIIYYLKADVIDYINKNKLKHTT